MGWKRCISFFHVSMLNKCVGDLTSIVPLERLEFKENLSHEKIPVGILEREVTG